MLARRRNLDVCVVCRWEGDFGNKRNYRELELLGLRVSSVIPTEDGDVLVCDQGSMRPGDWLVTNEWTSGCGIVEGGLFEEVFEVLDDGKRGGNE